MPNPTLAQMGFLDEDTQQEVVYDIEDSEARSDISTLENKIGSANGIAELDGNGLVPVSQLPSYVDDVLEGTAQNVTETSAGTFAATGFILKGELVPCTPEDGKTYVDTTSNIQYRWTGSETNFVSMGSNLTLGETANTAYAGNKGKANADAIAAMKDGSSIDSFGDVETALAGKVDKVQSKGLSTNDYTNADKAVVTTAQDNIKANTQLIKDTVGWSGKNKIPYPYVHSSGDYSGAIITDIGDGTVKVNGTNTAAVIMHLNDDLKLPVGDYIATKGSTSTSYGLVVEGYNNNTWVKVIASLFSNDKVDFTVDYNGYNKIMVSLRADANKTVDNLILKPMICDKNTLDLSFEKGFSSTAFPRSEQAVLGAKNLADIDNRELTNDSTFSESDGVYTIGNTNGTSRYPSFVINERANGKLFEPGKYTLSVNVVSFTNNTALLTFRNSDNSILASKPLSVGKMSLTYECSVPFYVGFLLRFENTSNSQIQFNDFMLRLASDPDDTYTPYAMTNRELTEKVQGIINAATNAADFAAFKTAIAAL